MTTLFQPTSALHFVTVKDSRSLDSPNFIAPQLRHQNLYKNENHSNSRVNCYIYEYQNQQLDRILKLHEQLLANPINCHMFN
jgi:hypothetical protein